MPTAPKNNPSDPPKNRCTKLRQKATLENTSFEARLRTCDGITLCPGGGSHCHSVFDAFGPKSSLCLDTPRQPPQMTKYPKIRLQATFENTFCEPRLARRKRRAQNLAPTAPNGAPAAPCASGARRRYAPPDAAARRMGAATRRHLWRRCAPPCAAARRNLGRLRRPWWRLRRLARLRREPLPTPKSRPLFLVGQLS